MKTTKMAVLVVVVIMFFSGEGWAYSIHVNGGQLTVTTDDLPLSGYSSSNVQFNIGEKITEYVTATIASLASSRYITAIVDVKSRYSGCKNAIRFGNGSSKGNAAGSPNALDIIQYSDNKIGIHVGETFSSTNNIIWLYPTANESTIWRFDYIVGILVKYCLAVTARATTTAIDNLQILITESGSGDAIVYTLSTGDISQ